MRTGIVYAAEQAQPLLESVRKMPGVIRAQIAGSLRRQRETIGDVDLIAAVADMKQAADVTKKFTELPGVIQIMGAGESKASVKVSNGMQVDLRSRAGRKFRRGPALFHRVKRTQHQNPRTGDQKENDAQRMGFVQPGRLRKSGKENFAGAQN